MNIFVFQMPWGEWTADEGSIGGSPPRGRGTNKYEAVGSLFFALRHCPEFFKYLDRDIRVTEVPNAIASKYCYRGDLLLAAQRLGEIPGRGVPN